MTKIGRNASCWCGSGKKYKLCHLEIEEREPVTIWELDKDRKRLFSHRRCMVPPQLTKQCGKELIQAHTVSKGKFLRSIARQNKVYSYHTSIPNVVKKQESLVKLMSINKASTFNGFCKYHDNQLFQCIDNKPLMFDEKQCFALAYRAICRELYCKQAASQMLPVYEKTLDGKRPDRQLDIMHFGLSTVLGNSLAVKDLLFLKQYLELHWVENKEFTLCSVVFQFAEELPFLCSGVAAPDYDFTASKIQDIADSDAIVENISVNALNENGKGYVIFSWAKPHTACARFIQSLLAETLENQSILIAQYLFKNLENVFMSPAWWDGLNSKQQAAYVGLMKEGLTKPDQPKLYFRDSL